jgi:hypothetical protein
MINEDHAARLRRAEQEPPVDDKVNLAEKLAAFDEHFSPKIVGRLND